MGKKPHARISLGFHSPTAVQIFLSSFLFSFLLLFPYCFIKNTRQQAPVFVPARFISILRQWKIGIVKVGSKCPWFDSRVNKRRAVCSLKKLRKFDTADRNLRNTFLHFHFLHGYYLYSPPATCTNSPSLSSLSLWIRELNSQYSLQSSKNMENTLVSCFDLILKCCFCSTFRSLRVSKIIIMSGSGCRRAARYIGIPT